MTTAGEVRRILRSWVTSTLYVLFTFLGLFRRIERKLIGRDSPALPRSFLVIRLDLMGDVVFTMPAVAALRAGYPDAHIAMLTLPYTAPIVSMFDQVDECVAMDTNAVRTVRGLLDPATWRQYVWALRLLRSRHFDVAISMSGRTASLCAVLSGARCVVGYAREGYPYFLDRPVVGGRYDKRIHEVDYCLRLASAAGAHPPAGPVRLQPPNDAFERAEALLRAEMADPALPFAALHIGAGHGSAKRWPLEHWASLAEDLRAEGAYGFVVLIGDTRDARDADAIVRQAGHGVVSLVGKTDIESLAALLSRARVVVSGDSGPLHLAASLGTPTVAIFGPTDPRVYGPQHGRGPTEVLWRGLPCSPCYSAKAAAECPLGHGLCMRLIAPIEVAGAVRAITRDQAGR